KYLTPKRRSLSPSFVGKAHCQGNRPKQAARTQGNTTNTLVAITTIRVVNRKPKMGSPTQPQSQEGVFLDRMGSFPRVDRMILFHEPRQPGRLMVRQDGPPSAASLLVTPFFPQVGGAWVRTPAAGVGPVAHLRDGLAGVR